MKTAWLYTILVAFTLIFSAHGAEDTVTLPKSRVIELEKKAAQADKLAAELEKARAEISRLKGEAAAAPKTVVVSPLPPQVEQSIQKLPPTRPLTGLPALGKGETVAVSDLLHHYAMDPAAADQRYKKKNFKLTGIVTDLDKSLLTSPYRVIFRVPGSALKLICDVQSPDEFKKVYVSSDRERIIGETYSTRATLAKVGEEITLQGHCSGLKDGVVTVDYSEKLSRP